MHIIRSEPSFLKAPPAALPCHRPKWSLCLGQLDSLPLYPNISRLSADERAGKILLRGKGRFSKRSMCLCAGGMPFHSRRIAGVGGWGGAAAAAAEKRRTPTQRPIIAGEKHCRSGEGGPW